MDFAVELPLVWVIFGPTASGKTGAGIEVAEFLGGEVVNADSRQVYSKISIIAAAPNEAETARVPHHLFEFVDPAARMSAQRWSDMCSAKIDEMVARGKVPVVVGGTGLYLRTLMEGLSDIPDVPIAVELEYSDMPLEERYAHLQDVDPVLAAKLHPSDTQRITRGLVVYTHTGVPLSEWQAMPPKAPPYRFRKLAISPDRELLYSRIETRWGQMVEAGVVDEVRALKDAGYTLDMPGLQGLGIAEIYDYLDGNLSWDETARQAVQGTRHYAKRQVTWLRNTYKAEHTFESAGELVAFVKGL
ncbi:MAG: tRNA (adenosine(37)-N6)-dimethylallyltransferase MiaA [Alphaproteobacteria bacterium]|nr:MAG: tRNA (adenosine(37)-N6)-dimethylallyltransferase MiaA [Alphaproteobacteria bacterium]